ncbi:MAG TPA: carbamoyltransferase HypF, partial [Armatimonadetes bacterium]|nr:carbamoyltransferase HypF [Armatimonadota bacterium]
SSNRRFHAQPNACPHCGPQIWLTDAHGHLLCRGTEAVLKRTGELIRNGYIVAIKGLGGFHLACDARNSSAVRTLRARKRRPAKPFAIMCADEDEVKRIAHVADWELQVLKSPQSPIVLLRERQSSDIAPEVAPNNLYQGVMLPYTPLHALLFQFSPPALVMTSGNLSEEPLCYRNDEALERLSGIADYFLLHDRDIHVPCDDSVVRPMAGGITVLRRARGYVPMPIDLPFNVDAPILGVGADLKNAFCIADERWAVMSQHIGDMENIETCDYFRRALMHLCSLLDVEPCVIAHDMHPRYYSTQLAQELSGVHIPIQHHYAHVLSCMVENGVTEPVIGVAFDGTGYGADGTVWGGEILLCTLTEFKRLGHLLPMPLAGGEAGIRKPARLAFSYIWSILATDALHHRGMERVLGYLDATELRIIPIQIARHLNTPMTSSMGRLFDATSALLGICGVASYEGQAAMELEMVATHAWDDARE